MYMMTIIAIACMARFFKTLVVMGIVLFHCIAHIIMFATETTRIFIRALLTNPRTTVMALMAAHAPVVESSTRMADIAPTTAWAVAMVAFRTSLQPTPEQKFNMQEIGTMLWDSGCNQHMVRNRDNFTSYKTRVLDINTAEDKGNKDTENNTPKLRAMGVGNVKLLTRDRHGHPLSLIHI